MHASYSTMITLMRSYLTKTGNTFFRISAEKFGARLRPTYGSRLMRVSGCDIYVH